MQAVVFDFFRTLVAPERINPSAYKRTDRIVSILQIDSDKFKQWWLETKRERNLQWSPTLKERIGLFCNESLRQPKSESLVERAIYEADRYHYEAVLNPPAEVIEALSSLRIKGVRIGVLSNCDEDEIRYLSRSPIAKLVDAIALSLDMKIMKPDPAAYSYILGKLEVSPEHSIFVGDGENQELSGAKAVGFARVIFLRQFVKNTGFQLKEKLAEFERIADITIDDIRDVISIAIDPA